VYSSNLCKFYLGLQYCPPVPIGHSEPRHVQETITQFDGCIRAWQHPPIKVTRVHFYVILKNWWERSYGYVTSPFNERTIFAKWILSAKVHCISTRRTQKKGADCQEFILHPIGAKGRLDEVSGCNMEFNDFLPVGGGSAPTLPQQVFERFDACLGECEHPTTHVSHSELLDIMARWWERSYGNTHFPISSSTCFPRLVKMATIRRIVCQRSRHLGEDRTKFILNPTTHKATPTETNCDARKGRKERTNHELPLRREWPKEGQTSLPHPCALCSEAFNRAPDLKKHIQSNHGGISAYRKQAMHRAKDAFPSPVSQSLARHVVDNFYRHMRNTTLSECSICARLVEGVQQCDLRELIPTHNFKIMAHLLSCKRYKERWPQIPLETLEEYGIQCPHNPELHWLLRVTQDLREQWCSTEMPVHVCNSCRCALVLKKEVKMPRFALANDLWGGPIPDELRELTMGEVICISRARTYSKLIRIGRWQGQGNDDSRQRAQRGNTVSFPQEPAQLLNVLPRVATLTDFVTVILSGPDNIALRHVKELHVRQWKIRRALQWLILHNPEYKEVVIDHDALHDLPGADYGSNGGIPTILIDAAVHTNANVEGETIHEHGPADAVGDGVDAPKEHMVVTDEIGDNIHPLNYWRNALSAYAASEKAECVAQQAKESGNEELAKSNQSVALEQQLKAISNLQDLTSDRYIIVERVQV
jgi:hypothetical protein